MPRRLYTVVAGDTLESVAEKFGCSPEVVAALSGILSGEIQPGEILTIP